MSERKFFGILAITVGGNVIIGTITALYLESAPRTLFNALVAPIVVSIFGVFTYFMVNRGLKDVKLQSSPTRSET